MKLLRRCARWTVAATLLAASSAFASSEDEVRAAFARFVEVQNAHDTKALEGLLADSPHFLWITRGTVLWGREAAIQRFGKLHEGTWRLEPELANLRVVPISETAAELHVPVTFTTGAPGEAPQRSRLFLNQVLVKSNGVWRVMSIFPIPAPAP
jgi:hypothetical protein